MRTRPNAPPDLLRSFLVRLPLTVLGGMLAWTVLRPVLDTAVPALAELLIRSFEVPRVTRLVESEHWVEVRRSDFRVGSRIPALPLTEVHVNTLVLLALAFALPRPWSRRQLERLLMAWAILLLTQGLNLVFEVKSLYATRLGDWSLLTYSAWLRNLLGFLQYFSDLPGRFAAPFVLWLALNWEVVGGMIGPAQRAGRSRSGGPTSSAGGSGSRGCRTPSSSR